jgi:hypothetical protein
MDMSMKVEAKLVERALVEKGYHVRDVASIQHKGPPLNGQERSYIALVSFETSQDAVDVIWRYNQGTLEDLLGSLCPQGCDGRRCTVKQGR